MQRLNDYRNVFTLPRIAFLAFGFATVVIGFLPISADEKPAANDPAWKSLFDGKTLKNWKSSDFGGEGKVSVEEGMIVLNQGSDMTGITWTGEALPKMNYEVSVMAQRIEGNDFFCGMTFEINDDPCSLIIGGWGEASWEYRALMVSTQPTTKRLDMRVLNRANGTRFGYE